MSPSENKEADEKIEKFASILEKFGLDIITKMGQTNFKINTLTDKVDKLSKATIDVKAFSEKCRDFKPFELSLSNFKYFSHGHQSILCGLILNLLI